MFHKRRPTVWLLVHPPLASHRAPLRWSEGGVRPSRDAVRLEVLFVEFDADAGAGGIEVNLVAADV